jgi:nucleoside-diphosphate-sugar epimerase
MKQSTWLIHCAYQIRELYGRRRQLQRRSNIEGARRVFEFALRRPSVRRLVQLSTVVAYGAFASGSERRLSFTPRIGPDGR